MRKTLLIICAIVGVVSTFTQCKKNELDFNKYDTFAMNPEILTPLASTAVVAGQVLKDSLITYDPDGLIHIKFNQDSVFKLSADSILNNIHLGKSSVKFSIGEIALNGINQSSQVLLGDLVQNADANTKLAFNAKIGTSDTFPAISSTSSTPTNLPASNQYDSLRISKGYLVFKITNHFPTVINEIQIKLIDNIPSPHTLGTVSIKNVAPGASGFDSINLAGSLLSNSLSYELPLTDLAKSPAPVLINDKDSLVFKVYGSNLKCIRGRAILPAQNVNLQSLNLDLSDPSSDARIRNLLLGNGLVPITCESQLGVDLKMDVDFPDATKSGVALGTTTISAPKLTTTNTSVNFTNCNLYLGSDINKPYNLIRVNVTPQIKASTGMVNFDSSNFVKITMDPTALEFVYLDGYLGTKTFDINIKDMSIGDMAQYLKGIRLENPAMRMYVDNSFGAPVLVQLDIQAKDANGNLLPMSVQDMNLPFPTIPQKGQVKSQTFSIDKSNSNIVNCLSMPATTFDIKGKAVLNPNGFTAYTDHVMNTSKAVVSFEADIPMTFTAKNFSITDTMATTALQGKDNFDFLELKIKTKNTFPLGGRLDLYFLDGNYTTIDSVTQVSLLVSGTPDVNTGKITSGGDNMSTYLINNTQLTKLNTQKCAYLKVVSHFESFNSGNTPVSIYKDCRLDITLAFRGKLK